MKQNFEEMGFWVLVLYAICSLSSMAGMNLGFAPVAAVFFWGWFTKKNLAHAETSCDEFKRYQKSALFLAAACILSLIAADWFPYRYANRAPDVTLHGYEKIWYLVVPGILFRVFQYTSRNEKQLQTVVRAWWWAALFLGAFAIFQFFYGWPKPREIFTFRGHYHADLFFGHHLSTSSILLFPTFTALSVALGNRVRTGRFRWFELTVGLSGLMILFLSYARTAWLAIPIGITLVAGRFLNRKYWVGAFLSLIILLLGSTQLPAVKERVERTVGVSERVELWKANIDYFQHRPLTGIGWLKTQEMSEFYFIKKDPENYRSYFWGHAHNNFFEMLGGTGLLGVVAFLIWVYFTFSLALRTSRASRAVYPMWSDFSWGLFIALVLLHFNGLTNVTFWEGKVMHQQMLAVGMLLMIRSATGSRTRFF